MQRLIGRTTSRGRCLGRAAAVLLSLAVVTPGTAGADAIDDLGKRLLGYEAEVQQLGQGIQAPKDIQQQGAHDKASRKLIDAQVAFGVGDFDNAALMLYDFVEQYPRHPDHDAGIYYLAESLFQKGDLVAARSFFQRLVQDAGSSSKFYQQGLERLIELSLELRDNTEVDRWLRAIEQVPESKRRSSVPYVQGKYAFFQEDYADARGYFAKVPKDSDYYFQSQYFLGASQVASGDLPGALRTYVALTRARPTDDDDKRVVELSWMALGRLHYERDQPSKAIDHYLQIDRRSDLFDEALLEVAWVYVKARQFDKALRALELLSLTDPTSSKMPEVKILEGNLRIRKAQRIVETGEEGNSTEQYAKAIKVFQILDRTFRKPYDELAALIETSATAEGFMAQITGRNSETFEVSATLPEVAAGWVRDEPEVQRVVAIETDLEQIETEIAEAEETIIRLERALGTPSRVNIFPALAEKKTRATEILEDVFAIRLSLATHERGLVKKHASGSEAAELERLTARRQQIAKQLADLPHAGLAYGDRVAAARADFDELDKRAAEVSTVIDATNATLVALQKYIADQGTELEGEALERFRTEVVALETELEAMRDELKQIRRDATLAKDSAGSGDEFARQAAELRGQLARALDDEHRALSRVAQRMSGNDRTKANQIASLTRKASTIAGELERVNQRIDAVVDYALGDVRDELADQRAKLSAYRQEFLLYEDESRDLGGVIIATSFRNVKKKFYDVLVRSDVGVIDVTWSQREGAQNAERSLELDLNRELQTLASDFRDIIREEQEARRADQTETPDDSDTPPGADAPGGEEVQP
jgi:tetratricopeptide (TPR) repeat protein